MSAYTFYKRLFITLPCYKLIVKWKRMRILYYYYYYYKKINLICEEHQDRIIVLDLISKTPKSQRLGC